MFIWNFFVLWYSCNITYQNKAQYAYCDNSFSLCLFSSEQLRVRPLTLLLFVCGAFFHRLDILGERMLIVHSIEIPHQTDSIDQR